MSENSAFEQRRSRVRIRDAATLVIYRRDADAMRLLMGRRSMRHVFMPGALVFPGGRTEGQDTYAPSADALDPCVEAFLLRRARITPSRARALAMAAIRETFEETGFLIGQNSSSVREPRDLGWRNFLAHDVLPVLSHLRFLVRAITPPGSPRRFDARFFVADASLIARKVEQTDSELESINWVTFAEARQSADLAEVTRLVIDSIEQDLERGGAAVPRLIRWSARGELVSEIL